MNGYETALDEAARKKTADFARKAELLEYPELQADKGAYAALMSEYGALKAIADAYDSWRNALAERDAFARSPLSPHDPHYDEQREFARLLAENADEWTAKLGFLLGKDAVSQRVGVEVKLPGDEETGRVVSVFLQSFLSYLEQNGVRVVPRPQDGSPLSREIRFTAEGAGAFAMTSVFSGVHTLFFAPAGKKERSATHFSLTAVPEEDRTVTMEEKDLRIDLFHSSGAGGQNVNKVETAVRVTHLPTGLVVTCQDERSQLRNRERAKKTLLEKLRAQKGREADEREKTARETQLAARKGFVVDLKDSSMRFVFTKKTFPYPLTNALYAEVVRLSLNQ